MMKAGGAAGQVVVLNGGSSSGKSSLARALQARWEDAGACWVIFGWDDFVPRLPARWSGGADGGGEFAADGCAYRLVDDMDAEPAALLEVGLLGRRMLAAYHRAVAAVANAGIDVIVEEVMITQREWDDWQLALEGVDVRWVAVQCPTEVAVQRERDRGDRYVGLARGTAAVVHRYATYDVEIDTSSADPNDLAAELDARLG